MERKPSVDLVAATLDAIALCIEKATNYNNSLAGLPSTAQYAGAFMEGFDAVAAANQMIDSLGNWGNEYVGWPRLLSARALIAAHADTIRTVLGFEMVETAIDKPTPGVRAFVSNVHMTSDGKHPTIPAECLNGLNYWRNEINSMLDGVEPQGGPPIEPECEGGKHDWLPEGSPDPSKEEWFGPLIGEKQQLAGWMGLKDDRALNGKIRRGVYLGRQEHQRLWSVWCRDKETYARFNQKKLISEQQSKSEASPTAKHTAPKRT